MTTATTKKRTGTLAAPAPCGQCGVLRDPIGTVLDPEGTYSICDYCCIGLIADVQASGGRLVLSVEAVPGTLRPPPAHQSGAPQPPRNCDPGPTAPTQPGSETADPLNLTAQQFDAALAAAVELRGREFTYPKKDPGWTKLNGRPRYVQAYINRPACLIGAALHHLGVPLATLRRLEDLGAPQLLRTLFPAVDDDVVEAARVAQMVQDVGAPWGHALADYRTCIARSRESDR